jgi:hypothetical protein
MQMQRLPLVMGQARVRRTLAHGATTFVWCPANVLSAAFPPDLAERRRSTGHRRMQAGGAASVRRQAICSRRACILLPVPTTGISPGISRAAMLRWGRSPLPPAVSRGEMAADDAIGRRQQRLRPGPPGNHRPHRSPSSARFSPSGTGWYTATAGTKATARFLLRSRLSQLKWPRPLPQA